MVLAPPAAVVPVRPGGGAATAGKSLGWVRLHVDQPRAFGGVDREQHAVAGIGGVHRRGLGDGDGPRRQLDVLDGLPDAGLPASVVVEPAVNAHLLSAAGCDQVALPAVGIELVRAFAAFDLDQVVTCAVNGDHRVSFRWWWPLPGTGRRAGTTRRGSVQGGGVRDAGLSFER